MMASAALPHVALLAIERLIFARNGGDWQVLWSSKKSQHSPGALGHYPSPFIDGFGRRSLRLLAALSAR